MSGLEAFLREARILIVDDEVANVRLLEANLEEDGQVNLRSTNDPREVLRLFRESPPDLILLDLMMPHLDGFAVMKQLQGVIPPDEYLPIIILTADISSETRRRALKGGARDFLTKPFDATELHLRIRNLLELRFLHLSQQRQNAELNERVLARTSDLQQALADLRESQRQAVQQERLHAFSEMAGGVVHDFNNSLAIILGYVEILISGRRLDDRAATLATLRTVLTAAQDAAHVVNRLRHFYRPRHEDDCFAPVSLRALVEETAALCQPKLELARADGRELALTLDLQGLPEVLCNASELREVLLNLVFNATDAIANGGTITLRLRAAGPEAFIEVADTGCGMSEEVRARCLEPFFSTKGEHGTGLGLAMVHGIIRRHEGRLEIESEPGLGTTFRIALPLRGESAEQQLREQSPATTRPLRILFAEDDPGLRDIIPEHLLAEGHSVEVASDGREALRKLSDHPFDVLVTDLSMPVMNGEALAAAVRVQAPATRIIMLTGFGTMLIAGHEPTPNIDLLLSKPITRKALSSALAQVAR